MVALVLATIGFKVAHLLRYTLLLFLMGSLAPALALQQNADYEKGVQAYHEADYNEAYIHLKNALQADPNLVAARLLLAQVHFNSGDIFSAEKEAEEALLLGADINLVLPVYGPTLILQRKVDKLFDLESVSDDFTKVSEFEWALLKGQGYLIRENETAALQEFERAAQLFPNDARSLNTLAAVYLDSEMQDRAAELIEKSLELNRDNAKTWALRAELAFQKKDYDAALKDYEHAHALDEQDIRVLRGLARTNMQLGNALKLRENLDVILENSPDDPAATLLSAILMVRQGDAQAAESMLGELSNMLSKLDEVAGRTDDSMLFIQASSEYVRRNDEAAISLLNKYLVNKKADLPAIRMLTDLYLRNGKVKLARDLLSTSKLAVTSDPGLSLQLLQLYIRNENIYAAKELLSDIQAANQDNPYAKLLEAELLRATGKKQAAFEILENGDFTEVDRLNYGLLRGALELDLGLLHEAEQRGERLLETFPKNIQVLNFATNVYLRTNELDRVDQIMERAHEQAPENIDVLFHRGMLLKKRGQYEASRKVLNQILETRPNHVRALLLIARSYYLEGNYQEAIQWSEKARIYDRNSSLPDELQLEIYTKRKEWDKALLVTLALAKLDPLNTDYLVSMAEIYIANKNFELAQRPLRRLTALWDENPDKLRQLAAMQLRAQNPVEARQNLTIALALAPDSLQTQLDLLRLDVVEGKISDANSTLDKLEARGGPTDRSTYLRGEIALAAGDLTLAHGYLLQAFKLNPKNQAAITQLYHLSRQGIGTEAFTSTMEATLQQHSLPTWAVRLLADTYMLQGENNKARRYYESLLALPALETDAGILNNLANLYAIDDPDKALATAREAIQAPGGDGSSAVLDTLGWLLATRGNHEEALPYLRKAFALNSADPEVRYHIGATLASLGRKTEAVKELRAALALSDNFTGRADTQKLLAKLAP